MPLYTLPAHRLATVSDWCLQHLDAADDLLLTQWQPEDLYDPTLQELARRCRKIWLLQSSESNHQSKGSPHVPGGFEALSYAGWVELCVAHQQIISW